MTGVQKKPSKVWLQILFPLSLVAWGAWEQAPELWKLYLSLSHPWARELASYIPISVIGQSHFNEEFKSPSFLCLGQSYSNNPKVVL